MSTEETIHPDSENEKTPPVDMETSTVLSQKSMQINFNELKPEQFGISVESFTPSFSSPRQDKSRLASIKSRRRSNIGVRGSPETNSLIRFMARQKMKAQPSSRTPEVVRSSPCLPQVASTLRQKMASFQSLMEAVKSEACDAFPEQGSNAGACPRTGDNLCGDIGPDGGKENNPPTSPTLSKKRRPGSHESCDVEIRETCADTANSLLTEQENASCQIQSPYPPPPGEGGLPLPPPESPPFNNCSSPVLLEMKPSEKDNSIVKKKKQVRFGLPLSPELFDKSLPPSTPLQKGGTPARAPTPNGVVYLRSVLKTPQSGEFKGAARPPDALNPLEFGGSPPLVTQRGGGGQSDGNNVENDPTVFTMMKETDSPKSDEDTIFNIQPLNLDRVFYEESLPQIIKDVDTNTTKLSQINISAELKSAEGKPQRDCADILPPPRLQRTKAGTKKVPINEVRRPKRKRKQAESEPVKRSTRSAAKAAGGKLKAPASRRWHKDVDRSLYGSRAYASKNPNLSPIKERLSLTGSSGGSAAAQTPFATRCPAPNEVAIEEIPDNMDEQSAGDVAVITPMEEAPPEAAVDSFYELTAPAAERESPEMRKVSVPEEEVKEEEEEEEEEEEVFRDCCVDDSTTYGLVGSGEVPPQHTEAAQKEMRVEDCADTNAEEPECAATLACLEEPEKEKEHDRRSEAPQRAQENSEERTGSCDTDQKADGRQERPEGHTETEAADRHLAPWQADFNFEDVFLPVASRGQRSVRRSMRNQRSQRRRNSGEGSGLAWLPHVSPETVKETRRRTGGRRRSAAVPSPKPARP